jgi:5-methylcytosine-specific restriction enzyme subunit McrC
MGERLWHQHGKQVLVEFPSPITGGQWRLTAQGVVGYIPLSATLGLSLVPKVPIRSLFGMLEYAYGLQAFQILGGQYDALSIEELYERLAEVLARRVLRRCRDGLVRSYVTETTELGVVRGNLNVRRMAQRPWDPRIECTYQEHTADIDDNQILAWTMWVIGRSGLCRPERALPFVRQAFRQLQGAVTVIPVTPADCVGRRYHRLNSDYAPLHALCRFLLEHSGPNHTVGDHAMLPFLVDMARLYEQFVVAWLREHLPASIVLTAQERYDIDRASNLTFAIDVVLRDAVSRKVHCVLDTKYKRVSTPSTDDIAQVVAYAKAMGCHDAILAYPFPPTRLVDTMIGDVRVRSVTFALDHDLEVGGMAFLQDILLRQSRG